MDLKELASSIQGTTLRSHRPVTEQLVVTNVAGFGPQIEKPFVEFKLIAGGDLALEPSGLGLVQSDCVDESSVASTRQTLGKPHVARDLVVGLELVEEVVAHHGGGLVFEDVDLPRELDQGVEDPTVFDKLKFGTTRSTRSNGTIPGRVVSVVVLAASEEGSTTWMK